MTWKHSQEEIKYNYMKPRNKYIKIAVRIEVWLSYLEIRIMSDLLIYKLIRSYITIHQVVHKGIYQTQTKAWKKTRSEHKCV